MPLDDRLRAQLHAEAAGIEPDVDRHLSEITRRPGRRAGPLPLAAITTVVAFAFLMTLMLRSGESTAPAASPEPTATQQPMDPADALVGTYRVRLNDSAQVADPSLLGEWDLVFDAESRVALTAPTSFNASSDVLAPVYAYVLRGDSLSTNLLTRQLGHDCAGPGSYRWRETDDGLAFETIEDTCAERKTILTSRDWKRIDD